MASTSLFFSLALASEAILVCTRLAECWWRGKKQNKTKQKS
jgi:hypothetical protein